jgi:hypothetical protein
MLLKILLCAVLLVQHLCQQQDLSCFQVAILKACQQQRVQGWIACVLAGQHTFGCLWVVQARLQK